MAGEGAVQIRVFDRQTLVLAEEFDGPVELGRQGEMTEAVYSRRSESGRWRLVIAGFDEPTVARRQVLVEPAGGGRVRLTNTSPAAALRLAGGDELAPLGSQEFDLPAVLRFGQKTVELLPSEGEGGAVQRLPEATIPPGRFAGDGPHDLPTLGLSPAEGEGVEVESLLRWLQAVIVTLHAANRSADVFETTARTVVDALGMDSGCVLLRSPDDRWRVEARHDGRGFASVECAGEGWQPSTSLLKRLAEEKRTLWRGPDAADGPGDDGACSEVAAPILDRRCEVIGVLSAARRPGGCAAAAGQRMRKLDAMLVELLATGLAAALARLELEKAAVAARVRFEQFFTPELAEELSARPDLLTGREVEVTMLFCDIRGFSRVSERIGPAGTVAWVGDVMSVLSDCVIAHHGVLVDYIGDELIAMWGAPKEDPDHALRACRSALDMLARLPVINARWEPILGEPTDLGIGVNTGPAQVGNTGSSRKFKYGALGNTVNLASRVQGATRYLKTRLLVTGPTWAKLGGRFPSRRLGKTAFVNIAEPVELYELAPPAQTGWDALRAAYEDALHHFETRNFREATRDLGNLMVDHPDDGPSLILLSRSVNGMVEQSSAFDPVWRLPGK